MTDKKNHSLTCYNNVLYVSEELAVRPVTFLCHILQNVKDGARSAACAR